MAQGLWPPAVKLGRCIGWPAYEVAAMNAVRIDTGAFRCMVCGIHGGSALAFHMQRHGLRFIEAARALGAWEESR